MIGAMDPDKMGGLCRRMLKSTIKDGSGLERKNVLAIDKHRSDKMGGLCCMLKVRSRMDPVLRERQVVLP